MNRKDLSMRFLKIIGFLLVSLFFNGCLGIQSHQRNQRLVINSDPPGATVFLNNAASGTTPLEVSRPYQDRIYDFNRWWWLSAAASSGLAAGGLAMYLDGPGFDSADSSGYNNSWIGAGLLSAGLAALAYSVYYCLDAESKDGRPVAGAKPRVDITTEMDGYLSQRKEVFFPYDSEIIDFSLQPGQPDQKNIEEPLEKKANTQRSMSVVAVFNIQDKRDKARLKASSIDQLSDYLSAKLSQETLYRVVPRKQLRDALLAQKKTSYRRCYDNACQIEIGKALSAGLTLITKIARVGRSCVVSGILYDLKSETAEQAATAKTYTCTPEGIMLALDEMVAQLGRSSNKI
jgi:hypothetical protein